MNQNTPALGAAGATLFRGEKVAVELNSRVGRSGREKVRVRVFGNGSFPWADVVCKWGAKLEAVVADNTEVITFVKKHCDIKPILLDQATSLPPAGPWEGIIFGTIKTDSNKDKEIFSILMHHWKPREALVMMDGKLSSDEVLKDLPSIDLKYSRKLSKARHADFGGVTSSQWHVVHYSRVGPCLSSSHLMTAEHYAQALQTSLDDTEIKSSERKQFTAEYGKDFCGIVKLNKNGQVLRVYDADGLAPDLSHISSSRFLFFWVRAASVAASGDKILRPI